MQVPGTGSTCIPSVGVIASKLFSKPSFTRPPPVFTPSSPPRSGTAAGFKSCLPGTTIVLRSMNEASMSSSSTRLLLHVRRELQVVLNEVPNEEEDCLHPALRGDELQEPARIKLGIAIKVINDAANNELGTARRLRALALLFGRLEGGLDHPGHDRQEAAEAPEDLQIWLVSSTWPRSSDSSTTAQAGDSAPASPTATSSASSASGVGTIRLT